MMEQKCLKCEGVLFKKVLLDTLGHTAMDVETPLEIESDGIDQFYRCPHCKAKNIIVSDKSAHGVPQSRVFRYKD